MPFERPTLSALIDRIRGDLRGRLTIVGPVLRRAMANILSPVWAGGVHGLHGHQEWQAKQLFADTADPDIVIEKAAMYNITPAPASFATGNVTATGTNGTVIPTGTVLKYDTGITFETTADGTITAGSATMPVEAVLAGAASNVDAGETVTFESPIGGVSSTATVAVGGISGGFDQEDGEGVRYRWLLRLREPAAGGRDADYEGWALAVAGVTRAWVYPNENGLGTVVVRFVLDEYDEDTGELIAVGFPGAPEVAAVQAKLDAEKPITAEVTAAAPNALTQNFTIDLTPDTAATRAAVVAELKDLFQREGAPGDGLGLGTILLSQMRTAIGNAEGVTDYTLTTPASSIVPAAGQLPVVGSFTWT